MEDSTHIKQVKSMLQDRQQCATVAGVAQDLQVSRTAASQLLNKVASEQQQSSAGGWHATLCQSEQTNEKHGDEAIECTVFRLSTKTVDSKESDHWKDNESCVLYALSTGEETYSTAQERVLAQLRDIKDNASTALACDLIAPAPVVKSLMECKSTNAASTVESTAPALEAPKGPQKPTTAAAFFGKKDKSENGSAATTTTTTTNGHQNRPLSQTKGKAATKSAASSMFQRAASSSSSSSSSGKVKATATVKQDEKENNKRPKAVGNADDFVGDEEESDEEEQQPSQKPAVVRERAPPPDNDQVMVVDEEEEDDKSKAKPTVYGAMDDFAKPKEVSSQETTDAPKRRRRRKRLVEKTTMDSSGYLQTEMQEVWEDIPSDDEEEEQDAPKKVKAVAPAPSRPKKKAVKPSGMKQGSLMGFFKKK